MGTGGRSGCLAVEVVGVGEVGAQATTLGVGDSGGDHGAGEAVMHQVQKRSSSSNGR
jgi:hypothetical protein